MQRKVSEVSKQVQDLLTNNQYMFAKDIAKKLKLSTVQVYKAIRYLRLNEIGVHSGKKGYTLSDHATKQDDVHFLRRLYGQRTSGQIALNAAQKDIQYRWHSIEDKKNLKLIIAPLSSDVINTQGLKLITMLAKKNDKLLVSQ